MSNQQIQDKLNNCLSFLEQDENNLSLLVTVCELYITQENWQKAQEYLDKANAINRIACLGHQGLLYFSQGEFPQAKIYFEEALHHEDTAALRYNLSLIYFITAELDRAAGLLSPLLDEGHNSEAKVLMARILHGQDELEKALELIKETVAQHPEEAEALGLLALLYFDVDEENLSEQMAQRALELDPENYEARLVKAMLGLADQKTTVDDVENLLQIKPDDCRLWFALGTVHLNQAHLDLAEYSFKKALEIYPEFYDCSIALGWCLLLQDKLDEALNVYQTAAMSFPELADSWGGMALVYALKEDFTQAEEFIQKSKTYSSDCFLTEMAELMCFNHHNPLKAKEQLIRALKNSQVPVSEKLAFMIEEMHEEEVIH